VRPKPADILFAVGDGPTTRVRLRVSPRAARAGIVGRHADGWKVRVSPAAEKGRANDAVIELLAEALSVPTGKLELVAGKTSRDKVVAVAGLSEEAVDQRLAAAVR
jgi:uncharacterized protein (TIGR00251 family)